MNLRKLQSLLKEKCPCDGCDQATTCKEHELACGVFAKFVVTGRIDIEMTRTPTDRVYKKIFNNETFDFKTLEI